MSLSPDKRMPRLTSKFNANRIAEILILIIDLYLYIEWFSFKSLHQLTYPNLLQLKAFILTLHKDKHGFEKLILSDKFDTLPIRVEQATATTASTVQHRDIVITENHKVCHRPRCHELYFFNIWETVSICSSRFHAHFLELHFSLFFISN